MESHDDVVVPVAEKYNLQQGKYYSNTEWYIPEYSPNGRGLPLLGTAVPLNGTENL